MRAFKLLSFITGATVIAGALWWRKNPSACPYGQHYLIEPPHPFITRKRLKEILQPQPGERILEVGPGTGYYSLDIAESLHPGTLDIFDVQEEMLNHTLKRASKKGLNNINAVQGDAQELPYPDETFDAAYLIAVLGEIPDQNTALQELSRVLKPDGRLVIGELFGDPHWVRPKKLIQQSTNVGFKLTNRTGKAIGYFARFERRDHP